MDYFIKVMLVDDDIRYARALQDKAYSDFKINLIHYEDWEEAKTELFNKPNIYSAVILDALGKINSDDKGENQKHITKAITDLAQQRLNLPYFVLTGYFDRVSVFLADEVPIFCKDQEEARLLNLIIEKFSSSDKNEVARKYPGELQFVERYYLDEQIKYFIDIYSNIGETHSVFEELKKLRIISERTMDILGIEVGNFKNLKELLDFIKESGYKIKEGSRMIDILSFFSHEIHRIPEGIYRNIQAIYQVASSVALHSRKHDTYVPSGYQIVAFKYGLLETIKWVGEYIENTNKK